MRHAFSAVVGFLAALALSFAATAAHAGESYLGTIIVTDGGPTSNWVSATVADGGTGGAAFYIAPNSLLTVQASANAYVCVDALSSTRAPTCNSTIGLRVDSNVALPTSCSSNNGSILMADGGLVQGCTVTVLPVSGSSVNATVWQRRGNEY